MDSRFNAKMQKEIRRRAFQRADELRRERQLYEKTQYTLAALQEVTGLQRPELQSIADAARRSFQMRRDDFFSIKNQILIALGICGFLFVCGGLAAII